MAKKICALTMVRNDEFYLRKWVAYYGAELGMSNLYVYLDGKDQEIPDWCPGVNVEAVDKIPGQVVEAEKGRLDFLSKTAAELLKTYDLVIGVDAGIIHQNVQSAEVGGDLVHHILDGLFFADIRLDDQRLMALGADILSHLLCLFSGTVRNIVYHNMGTSIGHAAGDGTAKTL